MAKIKSVAAHEILDSRGTPTIETEIILDNGMISTSSVPSGASTSSFEAIELRDKDMARFEGKGVLKACDVVNNEISKVLIGKSPLDQKALDQEMITLDGTDNKSRLGGNSILSVSQSIVKAGAQIQNLKLWEYIHELCIEIGITKLIPTNPSHMPTPTFNVINGGLHGGKNIEIQEFLVVL